MYLADAYPSSSLSAGALMVIAFVMVGALAFWLVMVYLADRQSDKRHARQLDSHLPPVAGRHEAPEGGYSEAGPASADQGHGVAV